MKHTAVFPRFEKLSFKDTSFLKDFLSSCPPYSDFNFTNLFAWDVENKVRVSYFEDGIALLLYSHDLKKEFYTLASQKNAISIIRQLLNMPSVNQLSSLRLIPKFVIDELGNTPDLIIEEDRDNFDYILSSKYHSQLKGGANENRRRHVRIFYEENKAKLNIKLIDLKDSKSREDILFCTDVWIKKRRKGLKKAEVERKAIKRVLAHSSQLPVKALGIYIDGILRAFCIYEYTYDSTAIVHFEKYDLSYKGIAPYVRHAVAKELAANGTDYINYEQDLGLEGLRQSKTMLHPKKFLKKYKVSIR